MACWLVSGNSAVNRGLREQFASPPPAFLAARPVGAGEQRRHRLHVRARDDAHQPVSACAGGQRCRGRRRDEGVPAARAQGARPHRQHVEHGR